MDDHATESHLLPFLWMHGEDEATLRQYVGVIREANCRSFCVESRPHPDFCGEQWWHDMDILLDEARRRDMRVWILDDSHFPTGYANGALKEGKTELCRQSVFFRQLRFIGRSRTIRLQLEKLKKPPKYPQKLIWKLLERQQGKHRVFDDDQILSLTAFGPEGQVEHIVGNVWQKPAGNWTVAVCGLSRNLGPHRNYINMMEPESCRLLIDRVYEPHWQHYREDFGKTIAGFFSDEPELGNYVLYAHHNVLGTHQDLPWSSSLAKKLEDCWGRDYGHFLPFLWLNDRDAAQTARVRVEYMDAVTKLVKESFSEQLGVWCRAHGVQYIGHLIEDNNTHTCTGAGLGHYFRGVAGMDMAGIDNIGGQVLPQGEELSHGNSPVSSERDGEFYHYMLAKLAVSAAQLDPKKQGRALCEIFGNYGWGLSMREMKYLADHFLVCGVNNFVPHAFSMAPYPDPDCPPHFYAHGHNPLYRYTGALFGYMERVAELLSGGDLVSRVAILYNAEAEWADAKNSMLPQKIGRLLYDRQIDYTILPIDALDQAGRFDVVLVPACRRLPEAVNGLPNALYIDHLPEGFEGRVVRLESLLRHPMLAAVPRPELSPADPWVRILQYRKETDLFLLVNEGTTIYRGSVCLPAEGSYDGFDPWENRRVDICREGDRIALCLQPGKPLLLLRGEAASVPVQDEALYEEMPLNWQRSLCKTIDYPRFGEVRPVKLPDDAAREHPDFSGFLRYETSFPATENEPLRLVIEDAQDSVEVFLNGESLGLQIVPPFVYELSGKLREGGNQLAIEVATTAARDVNRQMKNPILKKVFPLVLRSSGLTGAVRLQRKAQR